MQGGLLIKAAVGGGLTVIVAEAVLEHDPFVTVTVYVVVTVGEIVMEAVLIPLFQEYVPPPAAVRVAVEPGHIALGGPAVAITVPIGSTVTVFVLMHPEASVMATE